MSEKVIEFAKKQGYKTAEFVTKWKGYDVYEPVFSDELSYIGLPLWILVKGSEIRMTDEKECFEILDIVGDEQEIFEEYFDKLTKKKRKKTKLSEDEETIKNSVWDKIKKFFAFDNKVDRNGREHDEEGLFAVLSKKSKDILGEGFKGYKGKDAIDKLMIEKRGYIIDAFHRNDIGGIALIWGDEERGLAHIINRRKKLNQPLGKLLSSLPEVIEKGTLTEEDGDFSIIYKGKKVIVEPKLFNDKFQFLMTAYYEGIKSPQRGVY